LRMWRLYSWSMPSSILVLPGVLGPAARGPDRGPRLHAARSCDSQFDATDCCSWGQSTRLLWRTCMGRILAPDWGFAEFTSCAETFLTYLCEPRIGPTIRERCGPSIRGSAGVERVMQSGASCKIPNSAMELRRRALGSPFSRWGNSLFEHEASRLGECSRSMQPGRRPDARVR
jgi:hypothetical protein